MMSLFGRKAQEPSASVPQRQAAPAPSQPLRGPPPVASHVPMVPVEADPETAYKVMAAITDSLDPKYYNPSFDSVRPILLEMPMSAYEAEIYMKRTQAGQQKYLDAVSARLSREVVANYQSFIEGMRQISEIDAQISQAGLYVSNSLRKLGGARESLVFGTLGITYRRRRRERLAEVRKHLNWLKSLHNLEDVINTACTEHRYTEAVGFIVDAQAKMRDPATNAFTVLHSLRPKVDTALDVLRNRVDKALDGVLTRFDSKAYTAILLAYRELDECGVRASVPQAARNDAGAGARGRASTTIDDDDTTLQLHAEEPLEANMVPGNALLAQVGGTIAAAAAAASSGVLAIPNIGNPDSNIVAIAGHIQNSAMKAVKTLSKNALIDVLLKDLRAKMVEEERESATRRRSGVEDEDAGDVDDLALGIAGGDADGDEAVPTVEQKSAAELYNTKWQHLRQRSFQDLCSSLSADDIPHACMRVSAAIAHVMHSHYMLLQWHRSPFDPRNNSNGEECEFLHRSSISSDDTGEDDDPLALSQAKAAAARSAAAPIPGVRPSPLTDGAEFVSVLRQLRPHLLRGRNVIWQQMQQRFSSLLVAAISAVGATLPVERLAQCLIVAGDLMAVGSEYVGVNKSATGGRTESDLDPSSVLRGSLRHVCSQYMDAIHAEHFDKLKGMLSKELWQRVAFNEQTLGAIMESTNAGFRSRFTKTASAAIAAATAAIKGNDAFMSSDTSDESGASRRTYSDGVSLFSSWLDRGNPFGWILFSAGKTEGVTVLSTPRIVVDDDSDDEDEDEELFGSADQRTKAAAAAAQRRAAARLMRYIHGDGYSLEIGLGRGPAFGFSASFAADGAALAQDSDDSSGEEEEIILEEDHTSDDDDGDDEDGAGVVRKKKSAVDSSNFDASGKVAHPYASAFGDDYQHVVTAAALNGFARAVTKYVVLMEVLPTVSVSAFAGLARLFELYLFTVATTFARPQALKQLFELAAPAPAAAFREKDQGHFDYLDGGAFALAARLSAAAAESRSLDHRQANHRMGRKGLSSSALSPSGSLSPESFDDLSSSAVLKRGRVDKLDAESVDLYGVAIHVRGLPALAEVQGLPTDYYSLTGAGNLAGSTMSGNCYNSDGVYILLRRALQAIGYELAAGGATMGTAGSSALVDGNFLHDTNVTVRGWMPEPFVRPQLPLELESESTAFGVAERAVACESLDFLLDVLSRVRTKIETHIPQTHQQNVAQFFQRATLCACLLRALVYHSVVPRLLPESGALPSMVATVKWESIKEAMDMNAYTSAIIGPLGRVAGILNEKVASGALPSVSRVGFWSAIVSHIMERFVESISRVKKCTVPGRGLMALDANGVYSAACRLNPTDTSLLPRDRSYVEGFIAAFYFENEADLLQWVLKHKQAYALAHVRSIFLNGIAKNLKSKQQKDILSAIDAMYLASTGTSGAGSTV